MSRFPVTAEKERQLLARMASLGIVEEDLLEKFIRASGPGGQKVNKTASCVYLQHTPSTIEVKCQQSRSQALNRYYARQLLCERLEEQQLGAKSRKQQEIEKIRRKKRRKSRKQKERMLEEKRKVSEKKEARKRVRPEEE